MIEGHRYTLSWARWIQLTPSNSIYLTPTPECTKSSHPLSFLKCFPFVPCMLHVTISTLWSLTRHTNIYEASTLCINISDGMFPAVDCQVYHKIGNPHLWMSCFIGNLLQQVQAGPCSSLYNTTGFLELTIPIKKNSFVIRRILPVFTRTILLLYHE